MRLIARLLTPFADFCGRNDSAAGPAPVEIDDRRALPAGAESGGNELVATAECARASLAGIMTFVAEGEAEIIAVLAQLQDLSRLSEAAINSGARLTDASVGDSQAPFAEQWETLFATMHALTSTTRQRREAVDKFSQTGGVIARLVGIQRSLRHSMYSLSYVRLHLSMNLGALPSDVQSEFAGLQNQMQSLQARVEAACDAGTETLQQSHSRLQIAVQQISQTLDEYSDRVSEASSLVREEVCAASTVSEGVDDLKSFLVEAAPAVAEAMSDTIVAGQAHDSVRQRLEHAAVAAAALVEEIEKRQTSASGDAGLFVRRLARLECENVKTGWAAIASAASNMEANLGTIAQTAAQIADLSLKVSAGQPADSEITSTVEELRARVRSVCELLQASSDINSQILCEAQPLQQALEAFHDFAESTSHEIRRVALNIQIKAVWAGDQGVLVMLGSEAQRIAAETIEFAQQLGEGFRQLRAETASLIEKVSGAQQSRGQMDSLSDRSEKMINDILTTRISNRQDLVEVVERSRNVAERLRTETGNIQFVKRAESSVADLLSALDLLAGDGDESSAEELSDAQRATLETISKSYTMQSERLVHNSVTSGISGSETEQGVAVDDNFLELF